MPARQTASPQVSSTTTILLFAVVFLAFFPDLFHLLWSVPLGFLFGHSKSSPTGTATPSPTYPSPSPTTTTMWTQKQFTLPSRARGSYLITDQVVKELPEIRQYKVGLLNLFVQHTSCALSLNENWDAVRPSLPLRSRICPFRQGRK
jgi:hypothetical protein